jgi:hypothetical protein
MDHQDHARNPARRSIRKDGDRKASLARREALRRGLGQGVLEAEDGVAVDDPSASVAASTTAWSWLSGSPCGRLNRRTYSAATGLPSVVCSVPFGCREADPPRGVSTHRVILQRLELRARPRAAAVDHQQDEGSGDHSPPPSTHLPRPGDHAAHQLIPSARSTGPDRTLLGHSRGPCCHRHSAPDTPGRKRTTTPSSSPSAA